MIPKSRHLTLRLSPLLVFYGEGLLIIQYVFGMNLKHELPTEVAGVKLDEIGFKVFLYPCLQLAVQVLINVLLIHLTIYENSHSIKNSFANFIY
jgi:hypothetical protein